MIKMLKKIFAAVLLACILLTALVGCDWLPTPGDEPNDSESQPQNNGGDAVKIPEHPLYYSVKEDFPDYFYLWPTMYLGAEIDVNSSYYNVYGNISVSTTQAQYSQNAEAIEVEIILPPDGYGDGVNEIGHYADLGLERLVDGEWVPVPFDGESEYYFNLFVEDWSYFRIDAIPEEGKTLTKSLNTEFLYESLQAGRYRVILFLDDATQRYAEFDVK